MGTLAQTELPFKLEATNEMLTANAGLALFGEFIQGLGFSRWLEQGDATARQRAGLHGTVLRPTAGADAHPVADARSKTCAPSRLALAWSACPAGNLKPTPPFSASVSSPITCSPCSSIRCWVATGSAIEWRRCAGGCFICRARWCVMPGRWCSRFPPGLSNCSGTPAARATNWRRHWLHSLPLCS
jgi:hypothetical protein